MAQKKSVIEEQKIWSIPELAAYICSLPQNHDELEILIADIIKCYVHHEKYSVYQRVLEYALMEGEDNLSDHLDWLTDKVLKPKVQTHKELAKKWRYNTDHSCRDQMIDFQNQQG